MPRVRADDYEDKTQAILDSAAKLFARTGYPNAKMQDIAQACGATKSMLYHYFPAKDDLLFALLQQHLGQLFDGIAAVIEEPHDPLERFESFVQLYVQKSAGSRRRHVVAMNDVKYLPKARQAPILQLQNEILDQIVGIIKPLNTRLPAAHYRIHALMLVGMLNWTDIWYRPGGTVKPAELCELITDLFLKGYLQMGADARSRGPSWSLADTGTPA